MHHVPGPLPGTERLTESTESFQVFTEEYRIAFFCKNSDGFIFVKALPAFWNTDEEEAFVREEEKLNAQRESVNLVIYMYFATRRTRYLLVEYNEENKKIRLPDETIYDDKQYIFDGQASKENEMHIVPAKELAGCGYPVKSGGLRDKMIDERSEQMCLLYNHNCHVVFLDDFVRVSELVSAVSA